jgi:hypothetical protein
MTLVQSSSELSSVARPSRTVTGRALLDESKLEFAALDRPDRIRRSAELVAELVMTSDPNRGRRAVDSARERLQHSLLVGFFASWAG